MTNEEEVLQRARQFADQILLPIKKRNRVSFMYQINDLETGQEARNVVILPWMKDLWKYAVSLVESTDGIRQRVCVVGTAGVGKTTSTAWLIRYILRKKGSTVVYHIRDSTGGLIYEFCPFGVQVYPAADIDSVSSLNLSTTFYVVDPGNSNSNCDPGPLLNAKTIIISCPNSTHWGGNEFTKLRNQTIGRFVYMPTWKLHELVEAQPLLPHRKKLTVETIISRFDVFGGIPRHVLAPVCASGMSALKQMWIQQQHAVRALTPDQIQQIVQTDFPVPLSLLDSTQCIQSNCLALVSGEKKGMGYNFEMGIPILASKAVEREVAYLHISTLWKNPLSSFGRQRVLEAYCQALLSNGRRSLTVKSSTERGVWNSLFQKTKRKMLGGDMPTQCVQHIVDAAIEKPDILFCNLVSKTEPLIGDFCYRQNDYLHVFQVVPTKSRTADPMAIKILEKQAHAANLKMTLFFMVVAENFRNFTTVSARPEYHSDIYHVCIPKF